MWSAPLPSTLMDSLHAFILVHKCSEPPFQRCRAFSISWTRRSIANLMRDLSSNFYATQKSLKRYRRGSNGREPCGTLSIKFLKVVCSLDWDILVRGINKKKHRRNFWYCWMSSVVSFDILRTLFLRARVMQEYTNRGDVSSPDIS